jgi:hypothetical protein
MADVLDHESVWAASTRGGESTFNDYPRDRGGFRRIRY